MSYIGTTVPHGMTWWTKFAQRASCCGDHPTTYWGGRIGAGWRGGGIYERLAYHLREEKGMSSTQISHLAFKHPLTPNLLPSPHLSTPLNSYLLKLQLSLSYFPAIPLPKGNVCNKWRIYPIADEYENLWPQWQRMAHYRSSALLSQRRRTSSRSLHVGEWQICFIKCSQWEPKK